MGRIRVACSLLALGFCVVVVSAAPALAGDVAPRGTPSFPYRSVLAVYHYVQGKSGIAISEHLGWTTVREKAASVSWWFAPATDPAYPAVIKRAFVREGGDLVIKTCVMCESSQSRCDGAVQRFEQLADASE